MCIRDRYKDKGITKVVGIESRGFIMGPILATRLNAGFIPIRKPGKLPAETIEESYDKESVSYTHLCSQKTRIVAAIADSRLIPAMSFFMRLIFVKSCLLYTSPARTDKSK